MSSIIIVVFEQIFTRKSGARKLVAALIFHIVGVSFYPHKADLMLF